MTVSPPCSSPSARTVPSRKDPITVALRPSPAVVTGLAVGTLLAGVAYAALSGTVPGVASVTRVQHVDQLTQDPAVDQTQTAGPTTSEPSESESQDAGDATQDAEDATESATEDAGDATEDAEDATESATEDAGDATEDAATTSPNHGPGNATSRPTESGHHQGGGGSDDGADDGSAD